MTSRNEANIAAAKERARGRSEDHDLPLHVRSAYDQIVQSYEIEAASRQVRGTAREITNAFEAEERAAARAAKEATDNA